jgi:hypothetical protein
VLPAVAGWRFGAGTPSSIVFTPSAGTVANNTANSTQIGTFQVNMSDGSKNYTAPAHDPTSQVGLHGEIRAGREPCPFAIGTKGGTATSPVWPINTAVDPAID